MPPTFEYSLAAIESDRIDEVERELRIALPAHYRQFLQSINGGRPNPATFSFSEDGRKTSSTVNMITGIHAAPFDPASGVPRPTYAALDFVGRFRIFKVRGKRMPDELVPIAYDSFGNQICISVAGNKVGTIYFWDHENEVEPDADEPIDWYRNVHFIASSFNEFVDCLHE